MSQDARARFLPPPAQPLASGLPSLLWIIAAATVLANFGGEGVLGYRVSGLAWAGPLALAFVVVAQNPQRVAFPVWVWGPWILAVTLFWFQSPYPALQRTVQLLCPIAIAAAASTCRLAERQLQLLLKVLKGVAVILIAIVVMKTGILATGTLPFVTGLAPEVMTAMMFGCLFAADYACGQSGALRWWLLMALIPVVGLTRTAIVATGLTLPFTFAPLKMGRRLILLVVLAGVGWGLFYTPRIQGKMFRSGAGEMTDVLDSDFADSGRFAMWEMMKKGIRENPWTGHGTGAGELFSRSLTNGESGYPHNDWLLTLYDYGIVGTAALVVSLLAACAHAILRARRSSGVARLLLLAGASAFVPFAILMYTDNILVYVSFFGNLHFAVLGLGYGAGQAPPDLYPAEAASHG